MRYALHCTGANAGFRRSAAGSPRNRYVLQAISWGTSAGWPAHRAARKDVGVDVEHALADLRAGVENGAKLFEAQLVGKAPDARDQRGGGVGVAAQVGDVGVVLPRHDEHVRGRLRIDVLESVVVLVRINLGGRNLAGDDLAEQAVGGHPVTLLLPGRPDRCGRPALL